MNAIDACGGECQIKVKVWHDSKSVCIKVSDNGAGIGSEAIDKVFDPFFTTKDIGKGTGLGLSVCYNIIKQHNGEMDITSHLGQGTSVFISIPIGA
ncbi:MAG: hypothetical protein C0603_10975 [Denitrovibrio sp.]|nr:MAG: hypothetical protein C0603_10975 [Denitrovibrio sp.]